MLDIHILTIFPDLFPGPLAASITGRALAEGIVRLHPLDVRAFARDKHRTVDDYPYGGGPGMVMRPGPLVEAVESVRCATSRVIQLSPAGRVFSQPLAAELALEKHLVLICGRYEGIDERVRMLTGAEEISLGDYVLTGGELAAMVMVDAITRLQPGVLSSSEAWRDESHGEGLLECPQYTRPAVYRGLPVPAVLLSGHHGQVTAWRRQQALERTRERRPDLLTPRHLEELSPPPPKPRRKRSAPPTASDGEG